MTAEKWKEACNLSGNEDIARLDHFAAAESQINRVIDEIASNSNLEKPATKGRSMIPCTLLFSMLGMQ